VPVEHFQEDLLLTQEILLKSLVLKDVLTVTQRIQPLAMLAMFHMSTMTQIILVIAQLTLDSTKIPLLVKL
jgi:hypothetical protein